MKSSTLRFIALLPSLTLFVFLLLSLTQQTAVNALRPARMSTASEAPELERPASVRGNRRATSTTTQKPPSLRAPRLMRTPRPTTVMTHATTRTPTTTAAAAATGAPTTKTSTPKTATRAPTTTRRRTTIATTTTEQTLLNTRTQSRNTNSVRRRAASRTRHDNSGVAQASSRQTRTVEQSSPTNVRPNRSFLSAAATPNNRNSYSDTDGGKENKQIDNSQINTRTYNNNRNNDNNKENIENNNSNYSADKNHKIVNAALSVARTSSKTVAPATPPSVASATETIAHTDARTLHVARRSPTIDAATKPNTDSMTNHQNQPLLQRQSKKLSAQRPKTLHQSDYDGNDKSGSTRDGAINSARLPQTPKTPRMIQRLVAGHIQNAESRMTYQIAPVTTNSTRTNATTATTHKPTTHFVRTKGGQLAMSSSYRSVKVSTTPVTLMDSATTTTTTTLKPFHPRRNREDLTLNNEDNSNNDDEALLEDDGDFDNWDNGILRLSAGSGKENDPKSKKGKDESKKTLSDQVRDGKYGLIEKELFRHPPKRPGVLSYLPNKETPIDNERNFGGLNEEDIWLAEDHLLVIKGGSLNEGESNEPWPPIDDYDAPRRPIKLPPNPKVPPPFPVQLEENGPLQFIGNNKFTVIYPVANESLSVYPVGPETNYASPESDSDNEKNLITRPGTAQDTTQGEPGYLYPAPYPPWLYHNQTFVNQFLSNARPITFPNLGPFPLARNGSLENSNGTDYFDEDDPSLYYPPAYSFVYKSNYTNPVPPGPLVPGIVLPPPPNQFSRLEKTEKIYTPHATPPLRHRGYGTTSTSTTSTSSTSTTTSTTSTTSTSTTTTTSTTTEVPPYRPKVITKIHQYSPKTIIITPEPPPVVARPRLGPSTKLPPPSPSAPTPTVAPPEIIERRIPVPVAVHIPIFPSNKYPQPRPNSVAFEGTTPRNNQDTLSKSNPIYYEFFEAKRQPNGVTTNIIDDFLSTTEKPVHTKPIKLYATSKRPFKSQPQNQRQNYLRPQLQPQRQYLPQDVVYLTPKPEAVRYKRPPPVVPVQVPVPVEAPIYKSRPLENFEQEVNSIRETLRYYHNQQLRDNSIPRTPKSKPIYEFSFDASKNLRPTQSTDDTGDFQPPAEYDDAPFKPMVTYSPPVDDENSFHAIAVEKADAQRRQQQLQQQQKHQQPREEEEEFSNHHQQPARYQSTTTLVPVQPDAAYQQAPPIAQARPKKVRLGGKYLQQQSPLYPEYRSGGEQDLPPQYPNTPRTLAATQTPWVSLDQQQQELDEYTPQAQQQQQQQQQQQYQRIERPPVAISPKQRDFNGYYYNGPPLHARQNNRFYEEPFQQLNARRIVNYRQQTPPPLPPPHQPNYQQQQQQTLWSLENDTYVNYAPNRPPVNPVAEFINPYQPAIPLNPYGAQLQRYSSQPQAPPPPLSHQSQYYAPPPSQEHLPPLPKQQQQQHQRLSPQRQYQQQQQQQSQPQQIPLHRDILVNYRQPLPPINPDSEYISHPQVVRPQVYTPIYRTNAYQRLPPPPPQLPPQLIATGEQDGLYYIAPKYRRSNNSNDSGDSRSKKNESNDSNREGDSQSDDDASKPNANTNSKTPTRSDSGRADSNNGKK